MTDKHNGNDDLDSVLGFEEDTENWDQELEDGFDDETSDAIPGLDEDEYSFQEEEEAEPDASNEHLQQSEADTAASSESVDEDEIQPKGLLSTGSGKFVLVAGAVVVAVAAGGAYQMLFKGDSQELPNMSDSSKSANQGSSAKVIIPSENEMGQIEVSDSVNNNDGDSGFSLGPMSGKNESSGPEQSPVMNIASDETSDAASPVVADGLPEKSERPDNASSSVDDLDLTMSPTGSNEREKLIVEKPQQVVASNSGLSEADLKRIITDIISSEIKSSKPETVVDARVVDTLTSIQSKVDQLDEALKRQSERVDNQNKQVKKIVDDASESGKDHTTVESKRYPAHVVEGLKEGRSRLPGFKVFNSTEDGTMSVVRTPSNNVNVYFKGENFYITGNKKVTVESIHDDGFLVLVSDGYYIDETLVEKKKSKPKAEPKVAKEKEKPKQNKAATSTSRKPVTEREIVPVEDTRRLVNGREIASGWSLNATFGGDKSYLLTNPDGSWDTWAIGETIQGVGIISGLDDDRNLIVGNRVILLAK